MMNKKANEAPGRELLEHRMSGAATQRRKESRDHQGRYQRLILLHVRQRLNMARQSPRMMQEATVISHCSQTDIDL
jgi:hypothetical protein